MAHLETNPLTGLPAPVSQHINRKPAGNLHHAVRIAAHIGLPLNRMVTINFGLTDCEGRGASWRFAKLRSNYFGKWVRRPSRSSTAKAIPPTFIWVLEHGGGVLNVHWLVHVPPGRLRDFEARLPEWVVAVAGEITSDKAIQVKPAATPRSACRYLMKGIDPAYAAFYGIEHKPQGEVAGRRSGISRNLGPTVKRRLREMGQYRTVRWTPPFPTPKGRGASQARPSQPVSPANSQGTGCATAGSQSHPPPWEAGHNSAS